MNFFNWTQENRIGWSGIVGVAGILCYFFGTGFWESFGSGLIVGALAIFIPALFKKKSK